MNKATFAAGCFWGVEAAFRGVKGVTSTIVGYTGGHVKNPSYEDVCTGQTGHAEAVLIEYDPNIISYEALLEIFWNMHDPTSLNRQGPDAGTQYRSAIFCHDQTQKQAASDSKESIARSGLYKKEIVTQIATAEEFYAAEEYHQDYFGKHPEKAACHLMITKKII